MLTLVVVVVLATAILLTAYRLIGNRQKSLVDSRLFLFSCRVRGVDNSNHETSLRVRILISEKLYCQAETLAHETVTSYMDQASFSEIANREMQWSKGRLIDRKVATEERGVTLKLFQSIQKSKQKWSLEIEPCCVPNSMLEKSHIQ